MLPFALNLGIQRSRASLQAGRGAQRHPNLSRPASPRSSCARKYEPAPLLSLFHAAPQIPRTPVSAHKGATALPPLRCQMPGTEMVWAPRVLANETSVTPDACSHSDRAGRAATGRFYPSQGAGERPRAAAAPDRLKLTGGHRGAGQAGVAGRCHLRARGRCSLSPGADAASAALVRLLPVSAAPSPWQSPGDAQKAPASGLCLHFLLHQMTRCRRRYLFVVSVPLRAFAPLFSWCWAVGRWERREAKGRAERTDSDSGRVRAAVSTSQRAAGARAPGRP